VATSQTATGSSSAMLSDAVTDVNAVEFLDKS
jgi:hypothetical protein